MIPSADFLLPPSGSQIPYPGIPFGSCVQFVPDVGSLITQSNPSSLSQNQLSYIPFAFDTLSIVFSRAYSLLPSSTPQAAPPISKAPELECSMGLWIHHHHHGGRRLQSPLPLILVSKFSIFLGCFFVSIDVSNPAKASHSLAMRSSFFVHSFSVILRLLSCPSPVDLLKPLRINCSEICWILWIHVEPEMDGPYVVSIALLLLQ